MDGPRWPRARATAAKSTAEKIVQNIFRTAKAATLKSAGTAPELKMTVAAALAEARERIAMRAAKPLSAGKSLKYRLAFGIDFATVELGALVLVAYDFIGLIHFRKSLLRLRIVLILIRVVASWPACEGRFYFFGLRRFGATPSTL